MTPQFRITVTLDETLFIEIADMAAKDNRKVASMAAILLARQVKETNRKKKTNGSATATTE